MNTKVTELVRESECSSKVNVNAPEELQ